MNGIPDRQSEPSAIALLRRRLVIYKRAKLYQGAFLLLTLSLPFLSLIAANHIPIAKPFVAVFALFITFIDVVFLDRWHKTRLKTAAKLQEEFDCYVLQIKWNNFLVGTPVDAEESLPGTVFKLRERDENRLLDWYPTEVHSLPLHEARLVCQRTNLWYDHSLRTIYKIGLLCCVSIAVFWVAIYSMAVKSPVDVFVLTFLAPMTPMIVWTLREYVRHGDTIDLLSKLKGEVEKLLDQANAMPANEMGLRSRELQDAIYSHRVSSPLVFDWIYYAVREAHEMKMHIGVQRRVDQLTATKGNTGTAAPEEQQ